ncbi:methyltransferase [Lysobacter sp. N42]|uniref:class I SAM-dependent methyltransferase n=1 Tax=Lysobacter sp. N42 TaxID=2545719 RepID=UPI0026BFC8AB
MDGRDMSRFRRVSFSRAPCPRPARRPIGVGWGLGSIRALRRPRPPVSLSPRAPAFRGRPFGSSVIPGYSTRIQEVAVHGDVWKLRVLSDRQQFADPDGHAADAGTSSAQWPLFGQLWASGEQLAHAMHDHDVAGKRILELGCGIGLASLVLQRRGADVVASDVHPLAEPFLAYNAALNGLPALHYRRVDWTRHLPTLGRFDLVIASDVMYEPGQAELLADAIAGYADDEAEAVVVDPGRGPGAHLPRALAAHGFVPLRASGEARMRTRSFRRERVAA